MHLHPEIILLAYTQKVKAALLDTEHCDALKSWHTSVAPGKLKYFHVEFDSCQHCRHMSSVRVLNSFRSFAFNLCRHFIFEIPLCCFLCVGENNFPFGYFFSHMMKCGGEYCIFLTCSRAFTFYNFVHSHHSDIVNSRIKNLVIKYKWNMTTVQEKHSWSNPRFLISFKLTFTAILHKLCYIATNKSNWTKSKGEMQQTTFIHVLSWSNASQLHARSNGCMAIMCELSMPWILQAKPA